VNPQASYEQSHALRAIFWAGLVCGAMDITAAFVTWWSRGVRPVDILQGIASGVLGRKAYGGGIGPAALGLAFHFLIAFSAAAVFYAASRKIGFMTQRPIISGASYGVAVYVVMYWIVMPLSRFHRGPFSVFNTAVAIVTHIVCVGLPISLLVRRFSN
jgi:hypothetical protein